MKNTLQGFSIFILLVCCNLITKKASAQTDIDAIMMSKKNFCTGLQYSHSSWKNYWEGTLKRDNENLGKVTTQSVSIMGNYGISDKLNVLFSLPYIQTKASGGTLHGMKGAQDLGLWVKYMPVETQLGKGLFSLYGLAGLSFPVSNYVADFLPLSIGMRGTNVSGRLMADYQLGNFFATASGTYTYRSNIKIDRTAYYTDVMHLTNEVDMPDVLSFNVRTGYRTNYLIAEAVVNNQSTLGGFDIRRNDMPFPSNKMNATTAGVNIKYTVKSLPALSIIGGGNYVVAGRNVGQATTLYGGVFYILDFTGKGNHTDNQMKTKQ